MDCWLPGTGDLGLVSRVQRLHGGRGPRVAVGAARSPHLRATHRAVAVEWAARVDG
jgi:hypothetical protein